jgi:transcription-repair coupling factor (superfamily II helicase)
MAIKPVFSAFASTQSLRDLLDSIEDLRSGDSISIRGLTGSLPAFVAASLFRFLPGPLLCLFDTADEASFFHSDLQQIAPAAEDILLLPPSDRRPYDAEHVRDPSPTIQRTDLLQRLNDGFSGVIAASADAFQEKVAPKESVSSQTLSIQTGSVVDLDDLIQRLVGQGFARVEFVEQPGELALRGGILDVFPFAGDFPIRIEFFGDEVDSIREFDIHTQLSVSRLTSARLVPDLERVDTDDSRRVSIDEYLSSEVVILVSDCSTLFEHFEERYLQIAKLAETARKLDPYLPDPGSLFLASSDLRCLLESHRTIQTGSFQEAGSVRTISFDSRPQPSFNGSVKLLRSKLSENAAAHFRTHILCNSRSQEARIMELLGEDRERFNLSISVESLHRGFELPSVDLSVYTDHQIFNRYHRPSVRKQKQRFGGISLRELSHLVPGDFVVHIDHGIGKFAGMEQIDVRGKRQEVVRLSYLSGDILYVNVNSLYKLHKYKGKEGHQPALTRLGSGQWEKAKSRTKSRVKDIARDLIKLYAERKAADGFSFSGDSIWQQEMEASFPFEDTPDQAAASDAVKQDMGEPVPMDRLVCGDVGFGKTEIAVRAAFKAAQDGKQVAILVPTTVLAMQHLRTFRDRLSAYPVTVEVLSRFRSSTQIKQTLDRTFSGAADIVIGTHRLISKDVSFKDLGLLIIDEEQRFGVAVKEKLRQMRVRVDTLTLTATPIPRTLQFSLLGARDLSIIATAPPNRQPIETEIHTFDQDLIRDAILYETRRGGQVFFIHNRVQSIGEIADLIHMLVPDVRVAVGHGQMKGSELEKVMMGFFERKYDVLVSTNIIENGLDVSNANTIIINRADYFGLSELHQLRGRVGRSDRKAFCYLLVPSVRGLTREARQRLQAVEEFSELGSGFHIALRDLDIRGAGNLLGAEQTGFVDDIGYETYHRILDEAVEELRSTEFSDLFEGKAPPRPGDTSIDVEADAFIPEIFISNRVERLNIYRRISDTSTIDELESLKTEITDRFGVVPIEVENLLTAVVIKQSGQSLRLFRIIYKNQRLFLAMPFAKDDPYFYSDVFHPLIERLESLDRRVIMKESKSGRLRAIVQDVGDLSSALSIMKSIQTDAVGSGQS